MKPLYLISNVDRSGSSMMMRCLEAGGMPVAYDISQDFLNDVPASAGYVPNPNGFYNFNGDFRDAGFTEMYAGKAFKFPFRNLLDLPKGSYKLIFLKRDPEEIKASMQAFSPFQSWGKDSLVLEFYDEVIGAILSQIERRKDFDFMVLNYSDIVSDPVSAFQRIAASGWPIDAIAAAGKVDESLRRFNLENK